MQPAADGDQRSSSGDLVPKDEREVSFGLEVGTGAVLPGGKLTFGFRRKWNHRGAQFLERVKDYADTDEDELVRRVEDDARFADALGAAAQRAVLVGDGMMQDWLARLVAAAFNDDAKVDSIAFLVNLLAQLEPVHLRLVKGLSDNPPETDGQTPRVLSTAVHADAMLIVAAMQRLSSLHLAKMAEMALIPHDDAERAWTLTTMGIQMLELCEQELPSTAGTTGTLSSFCRS